MHNISIKINEKIFRKLDENEKILHKSKAQILKEIIENWFADRAKLKDATNVVGIWKERFDDDESAEEIQKEWRKDLWKKS